MGALLKKGSLVRRLTSKKDWRPEINQFSQLKFCIPFLFFSVAFRFVFRVKIISVDDFTGQGSIQLSRGNLFVQPIKILILLSSTY